ncbi:MAG: MFS transporter [Ahniella sp.]|nr:MFS transporter [Ahniella sp.]
MTQRAGDPPSVRVRLPPQVWALGFVSLLTDVSSELVHALLPLLLVGTLGVSMLMLGLIEGLAEGTASIVKLFSGAISDRFHRRKPLILLGYGLSAITKLVFPLAGSAGSVLAARVADRVGKGIRGAPRDALIADVTPVAQRGAAYGLRQSLDTVGAVLGPLLALGLMAWLGVVQHALWFAAIPGLAAVCVLWWFVREPETQLASDGKKFSLRDWRLLDAALWRVLALCAVLGLARFGEGFLIIHGRDLGLGDQYAPLTLVLMSFVFTLLAYPVGLLADRWPRRHLLAFAIVMLLVADLALATASNLYVFALGVALWGAHLGFSQGVLSAMLADAAPKALRGTAFGVFHLISGIAAIIASLLAGWIWQYHGAPAMFLAAAGLAGIAALLTWRVG